MDEDGAWYYKIEKNGKNGILISLDQIHFEQDSCRPYFYDADEPFYLKHPTEERPLKLSREKLKEDIIDAWNYERQRKSAIEEMLRENRGVEAYSDGGKWGFKFGDTVFIEPVFDSKPIMLGDFAKVEKDGKFGVVNRFGEYRLQPDNDNVVLLPNGYILYASKENWYLFGVIDPLTINGRLVKLSAYYHYKLPMNGEFAGFSKPTGKRKPQKLIQVGGVLFHLYNKESDDLTGRSIPVLLINWAPTVKYPVVMLLEGANLSKKSKHIDKPEDYITGESYEAIITSPIKGTGKDRRRIKGFDIEIGGTSVSHIYIKDIVRCGLRTTELSVGDKLKLTKLGFDDEFDRTKWRIEQKSK